MARATLQGVESKDAKRSLVIGASGQVGTQLLAALEESGPGRSLPTSRTEREGWLTLDLADPASVAQAAAQLNRFDLDAIYCLGSMTNVEACESEPEAAMRANADGPGLLAGYARRRDLPFVYLSTEYVFPGTPGMAGPYKEDSPTYPLNRYGESKLAGERAVLAAHPKALVLRTTVVYGVDAREKNYLYAVIRNLEAGRVLRVPEDQISTPTYNRDLAAMCIDLVAAGGNGVLHVCGPQCMSRMAFAQEVATRFGLDGSLLRGVPTTKLGQVARRPLTAGLDCSTLTRCYPQFRMRTLEEGLTDCLARL